MKFSIWPNPSEPWRDVLGLVQHCEASGWDGAYVSDHFMMPFNDGQQYVRVRRLLDADR